MHRETKYENFNSYFCSISKHISFLRIPIPPDKQVDRQTSAYLNAVFIKKKKKKKLTQTMFERQYLP